jgi:hypothetical protein
VPGFFFAAGTAAGPDAAGAVDAGGAAGVAGAAGAADDGTGPTEACFSSAASTAFWNAPRWEIALLIARGETCDGVFSTLAGGREPEAAGGALARDVATSAGGAVPGGLELRSGAGGGSGGGAGVVAGESGAGAAASMPEDEGGETG